MSTRTRVQPYDWSTRQVRWLRWAIGDGWTAPMVAEHVGCTVRQAEERMAAERKAIERERGPRRLLTDPARLAANRRARARAKARKQQGAAL